MFARSATLFATVCALCLVLGAGAAFAQQAVMPLELERVDVNEQLDKPLPLSTTFRDHTGKLVKLGDYFDGKRPVVLTLAYHTCKVVCSMVLGAEVEVLKKQPWTLGQEYRAVTISIDPRDTPAAAAKKRKQMLALYGRGGQAAQWDFLVGDKANIDKVARAVGFQYRYDERHDQFAHPAVLMMTTPAAKMARYLYGLQFAENDVRLGLLEASQGRSISTVEKVLLYCYMYDPIGAKYVVIGKNVMKLGGVVTMLSLGIFLGILWRRDRRRTSSSRGSPAAGAATPLPDPGPRIAVKVHHHE
jgi:protein SCO1/2